eukprot:16426989-Heterocapsa_arctica.AAC.1
MFVYRGHLAFSPCIEQMQVGHDPLRGYGHDWLAMNLCLRGQTITIIAVYLTSGLGYSGVNVQKLDQLA